MNDRYLRTCLGNDKSLSDEGDSKVLIISGIVGKVESDQKGQAVVVLSASSVPASACCAFSLETSEKARFLAKGDTVRIKGVIRSGASKDEDLGLYADVIVEKCDLVPAE